MTNLDEEEDVDTEEEIEGERKTETEGDSPALALLKAERVWKTAAIEDKPAARAEFYRLRKLT